MIDSDNQDVEAQASSGASSSILIPSSHNGDDIKTEIVKLQGYLSPSIGWKLLNFGSILFNTGWFVFNLGNSINNMVNPESNGWMSKSWIGLAGHGLALAGFAAMSYNLYYRLSLENIVNKLITSLSENIDRLEKNVSDLELNVNQLKTEITTLKAETLKLKELNSEYKKENGNYQALNENMQLQLENLNEKLKSADDQYKKLTELHEEQLSQMDANLRAQMELYTFAHEDAEMSRAQLNLLYKKIDGIFSNKSNQMTDILQNIKETLDQTIEERKRLEKVVEELECVSSQLNQRVCNQETNACLSTINEASDCKDGLVVCNSDFSTPREEMIARRTVVQMKTYMEWKKSKSGNNDSEITMKGYRELLEQRVSHMKQSLADHNTNFLKTRSISVA